MAAEQQSTRPTYLGLDFSTQQLKAVIVDDDLAVLHETNVQYDNDLPEFRTYGGVLQTKAEPNVVTVPSLMWVKALDMIMDRLRVCGVDFSRVAAVSGSAQQHGTVYWARGARKTLGNLDPDKFLHEQLVSVFSVTPAPIWMDSSTSPECKQLEDAVGGPQRMAEITGSRAYERFSGPQIAKIYKRKPEAYEATERISLVSSFAASLLLGEYAPIDWADGSGMNLLDLRAKDWSDELLEACAPGLRDKLGPSVSSSSDCGPIAKYFVERFGFDDNCRVVAFTGDNPASMAGLRLGRPGDLACSLGTSDVLFLWLNEPKVVSEGHVFCNPVADDAYMAVLCSKNGSLTRERIRNSAAGGDWKIFNELLDNTPRGNFGNCALYLDTREIYPAAVGDHRFNKANERVGRYSSKEVEVRALVEGQFIGRRAYAEDFGFELGQRTRIIATGGASANQAILQVLADVFDAPVYVAETPNSASMGAAYRAKHALCKQRLSFQEALEGLAEPRLVCRPYDDANSIYAPMVERYRLLVERILNEQA